jgi:hypothetical protein
MSRLASSLGDVSDLRIKTFTLGNHEFKVRVPLTAELDAIQKRIDNIPEKDIQQRFSEITKGMEGEGIERTKDDVIVAGRSSKELAKTVLSMESRIVEFIKLLVPENGNLQDITYAEIEAEWTLQTQMEILAKISEAIAPGYKDSRKN